MSKYSFKKYVTSLTVDDSSIRLGEQKQRTQSSNLKKIRPQRTYTICQRIYEIYNLRFFIENEHKPANFSQGFVNVSNSLFWRSHKQCIHRQQTYGHSHFKSNFDKKGLYCLHEPGIAQTFSTFQTKNSSKRNVEISQSRDGCTIAEATNFLNKAD